MLSNPKRAESTAFIRATATCAWWNMVFIPSLCASSIAAATASGDPPRNLMPSAPRLRTALTHARDALGSLDTSGKSACATIRGAAILPSSLIFLWSSVQPKPINDPASRTVVIPWASHNLATYSGSVMPPPNRCEGVPKWVCALTKPGITYLPLASITWVSADSCTAPIASEPVPAPTMSTMRSFSITMLTGPCTGAPAPSMM